MTKQRWAYDKNPYFTKSLENAKKRIEEDWTKEKYDSVKSVRVYRRAQSRRAHED